MPLSPAVSFDVASAALCAALIVSRLAYRFFFRCKVHKTCHRRWRIDDAYMAFALLPLIARVVTITMSFLLNPDQLSTPVTQAEADAAGMSVGALADDRMMALRLVIPARICYMLFLWSLKLALLSFYTRFVDPLDWGHTAVRALWCLIMATMVVVLIVTLLECRPLHLAWDLAPSGHRDECARGLANLLTMAIANIITDLALIILPFPILRLIRLDRKAKIQLTILFGIGLVVVVITILRVPLIMLSSISQRSRSMWASIEILCACIVANASFFYALVKDFQGHHNRSSKPNNQNIPPGNFYLQSLPSSFQRVHVMEQPQSPSSKPLPSAKRYEVNDDLERQSKGTGDID